MLSLAPVLASGRQDTLTFKSNAVIHRFPQKSVYITKSVYDASGLNFLVLHDDENTGVLAAHDFCRLNGGSITELEYGNERNISFSNRQSQFSFDPNQIFNNAGAAKTLKKYSHSKAGTMTVIQVRQLAINVLDIYNPDSLGYIVTLHNNTDGNFSINSYAAGQYLYGTADSVYVNPEMDADDLVFVTEPSFYGYLKQQQINAVLQSPQAIDGSLSVYAQLNQIPYVNIEVQDGHHQEHLRLILAVHAMLKDIALQPIYAKKEK